MVYYVRRQLASLFLDMSVDLCLLTSDVQSSRSYLPRRAVDLTHFVATSLLPTSIITELGKHKCRAGRIHAVLPRLHITLNASAPLFTWCLERCGEPRYVPDWEKLHGGATRGTPVNRLSLNNRRGAMQVTAWSCRSFRKQVYRCLVKRTPVLVPSRSNRSTHLACAICTTRTSPQRLTRRSFHQRINLKTDQNMWCMQVNMCNVRLRKERMM
jgi:hypothetical protein